MLRLTPTIATFSIWFLRPCRCSRANLWAMMKLIVVVESQGRFGWLEAKKNVNPSGLTEVAIASTGDGMRSKGLIYTDDKCKGGGIQSRSPFRYPESGNNYLHSRTVISFR